MCKTFTNLNQELNLPKPVTLWTYQFLNGRQVNGLGLGKSYAELIYKSRIEAGLTQLELADRVGVARSTELRWEHGKSIPNIPNMRTIAEVLHIPDQRWKPLLEQSNKKHQTVVPDDCGQVNLPKR